MSFCTQSLRSGYGLPLSHKRPMEERPALDRHDQTSTPGAQNDDSRESIVSRLDALPNARLYGCLGHPKIGGLDYLYAISGARIGVHINAVNDVAMYHSDRLTHYLACGTCVLAKAVPDSERMFVEHKHLRYYHDWLELQDLIDYYRKPEAETERRTIADQGMRWMHQEFNSQKIARYILDIIEQGTYTAPWTD